MGRKKVYLVALISVLMMARVPAAAEPLLLPVEADGPVHDPARLSFRLGQSPERVALLDMAEDGGLEMTNGKNPLPPNNSYPGNVDRSGGRGGTVSPAKPLP